MNKKIDPSQVRRHELSVKRYPSLGLSEGEYVILSMGRHPIGVVVTWLIASLPIVIALVFSQVLSATNIFQFNFSNQTFFALDFMVFCLAILMVLAGIIGTTVYKANRFFLTNESVIQHIQLGLFSKKSQTIGLGNVEDVSFRQAGILQTVLNYGTIRLSTEGEETTYRFEFVADPSEKTKIINNVLEKFRKESPESSTC